MNLDYGWCSAGQQNASAFDACGETADRIAVPSERRAKQGV
jgi:hypothetical protein